MTADEPTPELKPCPYCGCALERGAGHYWFHPETNCLLGRHILKDRDAPEWNRRACPPEARALLEECLRAMSEFCVVRDELARCCHEYPHRWRLVCMSLGSERWAIRGDMMEQLASAEARLRAYLKESESDAD